MKLKYIYSVIVATLAFLTSCSTEDNMTLLDNIKVSESYVSLPVEGGSHEITINTTGDWKLERKYEFLKKKTKAGKDTLVVKDSMKWVSFSKESGTAGEHKIIFTCPKTLDGRTGVLTLTSNGQTQNIILIQGLPVVKEATSKEINEGIMGKTYRITGICASIVNYDYGNMYIEDKLGQVYVYGTLDKNGGEKNFKSLGIDVGDEITVEGPLGEYKGSPQLVNVSVIKINKSLIKVDSLVYKEQKVELVPFEGGELAVNLTTKGQGVSVVMPDAAKPWLAISSIDQKGTTAVIKFNVANNDGGDRSVKLTFMTNDGKKDYTASVQILQKGPIHDVTIAKFKEQPKNTVNYRLSGTVTRFDSKGNPYIKDETGEVLLYSLVNLKDYNPQIDDVLTVVGHRGDYKGTAQLVDGMIEAKN